MRVVETRSAEETVGLGERMGQLARPGWVIGLSGDLGAGKTTLVKGVAAGLGLAPEAVTSPTFTFLHVYPGRIPIYHVDLYRLDRVEQTRDLGLEEFLGGDGVALVEWFENVPGLLPAPRLEARMEVLQGDRRRIRLEPVGSGFEELLGALR